MAQQSYHTILAPATAELVEKRSRFIAQLHPVSAEAEAAAFVAQCKSRYHDARHNCSAYLLRGGVMRYSDDGEPQGTAGVPMLEVLRREGLVDVAAVVTRYFGGILLGAGGLARAYSGSVKQAVDAAQRVLMCPCTLLLLELPYAAFGKVGNLLEQMEVLTLDSDFAAAVTLSLQIRSDRLEEFSESLTDLSGGALSAVITGEEFLPLPCQQ